MPSQPEESVAEDLRNILAMIRLLPEPSEVENLLCEVAARVESALAKLDATTAEERAIGRREQELGIMQDRADFETGQPLDYVRPGQHDVMLRGQRVDDE